MRIFAAPCVADVEMRMAVIVEVHRDHQSEEATDRRHPADDRSPAGRHRHSPSRRGNTVATSIPSRMSVASQNPRKLDPPDAAGRSYASRIGLRALWTEWSVEVRVLSGALAKPRTPGLFAALSACRCSIN